MTAEEIFPTLDIVDQAIKLAELDTTAEFKVHLEKVCHGSAETRADEIFKMLELHKTLSRNAILIYVAIETRKFHIYFDIGIQKQIDSKTAEMAGHIMLGRLREDQIAMGIAETIEFLGTKCKKHFPYRMDDVNEIDDEISMFGMSDEAKTED